MVSQQTGIKIISENRKARHDYHIERVIEMGIQLMGSEVKSCREGKVQLADSFAGFERGELFLFKVNIGEYRQGGPFFNHPPVRKRKLLAHKRELRVLSEAVSQKGMTLVPLKVYFTPKGLAKVEIGVAKGKTMGDKRQTLKSRDAEMDMAKARRRTRDE